MVVGLPHLSVKKDLTFLFVKLERAIHLLLRTSWPSNQAHQMFLKVRMDGLESWFFSFSRWGWGCFSYLMCLRQPHQQFTGLRCILWVVPTMASSLSPVPCCKYYREKWFAHETNAFCYTDGTMSLVKNEVPAELHRLYTSRIVESMDSSSLYM